MEHTGTTMIVATLIFLIPVLAIIGGIVGGILKARGRQRLIEMIHRERIAAIERGVDPSKLPPLPALDEAFDRIAELVPTNVQKAQGFLITGLVLVAAGLGLALMLLLLPDVHANRAWAAGVMPLVIGIAFLFAGLMLRRSADDERTAGQRPR